MDAVSSSRSQLNVQPAQHNSLPGSKIDLQIRIELDEIRRCQDEFQEKEESTYEELLNKFEFTQWPKIAKQFRNIESLTKFYAFLLDRKVPLNIPMGMPARIYLGEFPDPDAQKTSDELSDPQRKKASSLAWNNALTAWSVNELKNALKTNPNLLNMPDQHGMTALMHAIYRKDVAMTYLLLELGADPKSQLQVNRYPDTTLQIGWLTLEQSLNEGTFTHSLITEIANSPSLVFAGSNALTLAIQCKASPDIIKILCKYGQSKNANCLNEQDGQGRTPLTLAVAEGNAEIVTTLINAGAMIDQKDHQGKTPLMVATINNDIGLINTCILNNANPLLQNKDYKNAFSFACRFGTHEEINALFKSREAPLVSDYLSRVRCDLKAIL